MSTLPLYIAYVGTAIALLTGFSWIYMAITPYNELALVRAGNRTASISLGGVLIGFGLALSGAASNSHGLLDMILWGIVSLACQVAVYFVAAKVLKGLREGIESDKESFGILLAAMSITMGLINMGAVSY